MMTDILLPETSTPRDIGVTSIRMISFSVLPPFRMLP
jgi:hypothetical protein